MAYTFIKTGRVLSSISLSFVSLVFDDFTNITSSIRNQVFYRLIFTAWGPVAVLLINCYSGLIVSELNAPLQADQPEVIYDLLCENRHMLDNYVENTVSNYLKKVGFEKYKKYWGKYDACQRSGCFTPSFKNEYASNECYRFFSDSVEDPDTKIGSYNLYCARAEIFNEFLEFDITNNPTFENLTKENLLELLLTNPAHSYIPSGYSHEKQNYSASELQGLVEKDMINCNEKSAFIAATEIALAERDFLRRNYPSKKFHIWNTFFGPFKYGWLFQPVAGSTTSSGVSVVHRNFQALVVSGIYDRVRNEILRGMWLGRKPVANDTTEIVSKIEINGRIRTIFILCGVLICLAFAAVLVEGYKCEYNLLVKMFFKSASFLVKCRNFLRDNGITCGKIKRKRNYWAAPPVVNKVYIPPQLPAAGPRSP